MMSDIEQDLLDLLKCLKSIFIYLIRYTQYK